MDVPFDNIRITNLVPDDVLEGEDVDVINADGFDSDPGNDDETSNYRRRRLAELSREMEGTGPSDPNREMEAGPSGSSGLSTRKKRKNTGTNQACSSALDAHDKGDLCPWVLVNPEIPVKAVQDQLQRDLELQISMSKAFRAKAKAEREIRGDHVLQYSMLRDYVVELQSTNPNTTVKIAVERNTDPSLPTRVFQRIYVCLGALKLGFRACKRELLGLDGAFMKGPFPGQCLGDDIDLHPNSNFTFISDRQKGIIPAIKTVFPSAEHRYCLRHIHENMKQGWCGQAYKDLLCRSASTTSVKEFENYMEYCMKRIVNVQSVIDKCIGPLTPTATRIMESIKKETRLMKVQWNGANKYQVSGSLGDQCVVDVADQKKKRKRSKHEDEPFVKDGKLSKKGRTITCQSCGNMGHNMGTCKGQGDNNAKASGSASRQPQQAEPAIGQDGLGGSGVGAVIGLSDADGACGVGGAGSASTGVGSQGSSHSKWIKRRVQTKRISVQKRTHTQPGSQPSTNSQVPVSETRNADEREIGDGIPTQSSAAGGASEWSFM
ncbi:hypothetical protein Tco_0880086 [Tanacetum coccineum]